MKRILLGIGGLVLVVAALMWGTAATSAPHGGGGGGHAGGGHAVAHVGSVHYGAAPVHAMAGAGARAGSVRSEHYAGSGIGGGYRNPYSAGYFGRFRPGYSPYILGGAQYYGYDSLPFGCQQVVLNGIAYYLLDGVYYQPYIYGGQTVYLVAPDL